MNKVALISFVFAATCAIAETPSPLSSAENAFRRALGSSASWTMSRRISDNGPMLKSSGIVECVAKSAIVWRVTAPFASSVAMTTNAMVFADEDGVRVKPLAELPHYAEIREKIDAFVAGDPSAFDGLFETDCCAMPDGGWRLVLTPKVSAMTHLFAEIVLSGAALPTNAVLKANGGGMCTIRFSPIGMQ